MSSSVVSGRPTIAFGTPFKITVGDSFLVDWNSIDASERLCIGRRGSVSIVVSISVAVVIPVAVAAVAIPVALAIFITVSRAFR